LHRSTAASSPTSIPTTTPTDSLSWLCPAVLRLAVTNPCTVDECVYVEN
jgi:hypothetical protein